MTTTTLLSYMFQSSCTAAAFIHQSSFIHSHLHLHQPRFRYHDNGNDNDNHYFCSRTRTKTKTKTSRLYYGNNEEEKSNLFLKNIHQDIENENKDKIQKLGTTTRSQPSPLDPEQSTYTNDIENDHKNNNDHDHDNENDVMQTQPSQSYEQYKNKKLDLQLLLLDNYDSYTYNLYSYLCTICKQKPIVVSNDAYGSWEDLVKNLNTTGTYAHIDGIVISPGPGRPEHPDDMGVCLEAIEKNSNVPILGVCLGHQALGYYYNASVQLAPHGPTHGLTSKVWYKDEHEHEYEHAYEHEREHEHKYEYAKQQNESRDGSTIDLLSIATKDNEAKSAATTTTKNENSLSTSILQRCNLFKGISQFFNVVRYHSLIVQFPSKNRNKNHNVQNEDDDDDVENGDVVELDIEPIAWCIGNAMSEALNNDTICQNLLDNRNDNDYDSDIICMGLQHKIYPHYGVQFHPESIGTGELGFNILKNFCEYSVDWWRQKKDEGEEMIYATNDDSLSSIISSSSSSSSKTLDTNGSTLKINKVFNDKPIETNILQNDTKKTKKESIYEVLIHKVETKDNIHHSLPLPEQVFEEFYASMDAAFWLDSSTGCKDADIQQSQKMPNLYNQNQNDDRCPIVSNSRFSIMGCNNGPLSRRIEYWGDDHPKTKRGVYVIETNEDQRIVSTKRVETDVISYLHHELEKKGK